MGGTDDTDHDSVWYLCAEGAGVNVAGTYKGPSMRTGVGQALIKLQFPADNAIMYCIYTVYQIHVKLYTGERNCSLRLYIIWGL